MSPARIQALNGIEQNREINRGTIRYCSRPRYGAAAKRGDISDTQLKLLVVDDEALILMSLSAILTESGYSVRTALDGFSALTEIRREAPDLIISDLNMPRVFGFELLSVVRRRFPAIPVIAMSGAYSGDGVPPTASTKPPAFTVPVGFSRPSSSRRVRFRLSSGSLARGRPVFSACRISTLKAGRARTGEQFSTDLRPTGCEG